MYSPYNPAFHEKFPSYRDKTFFIAYYGNTIQAESGLNFKHDFSIREVSISPSSNLRNGMAEIVTDGRVAFTHTKFIHYTREEAQAEINERCITAIRVVEHQIKVLKAEAARLAVFIREHTLHGAPIVQVLEIRKNGEPV